MTTTMFPIRFKALKDLDADEGTAKLVDGAIVQLIISAND
jgi:hypothetical protein